LPKVQTKHKSARITRNAPLGAIKSNSLAPATIYLWIGLAGVLVLSFLLNTAALDWGQTGDVSWSPDSIDGRITAVYLPYLGKMWKHKYPRGQYLVSSIFYRPKIAKWEKEPVMVSLANGQKVQTSIDQKRLYQLASISRRITVFMSLGTIVAVFLTARKLCEDNLAGVLAGLCLALSCHYVFYSQQACVDVPAFFWFAWAGCFGLYAIKSNNLLLYLLAGFCAAWSVCTKEGVATFHIGLALALAILLVRTKMSLGQSFGKALLALVHWKVLSAAAVAAVVFVTLEGMWTGLDEWHYRSQFWKGVVEGEFQSQGFSSIHLLQKTYDGLLKIWGGPLLILLAIALVYWIFRYRWQLCLTVLPLLAFFMLTVLMIGQNLPRFMMCGLAGMAIMMGKTLADWYRYKRIPLAVRQIVPLLVIVPSLICCVCFDLEMNNDTRVRTEQWMRNHAQPGAIVGLSMKKQYAPRVWLDGFRAIPRWDSEGVMTQQGIAKIWPDYLIGSNQWPCIAEDDKPFFEKMFKGETPYEEKAQYNRLYFHPKTAIWKYCLRFFVLDGRISPRMMIYQKGEG
jgi:hypothetical protein